MSKERRYSQTIERVFYARNDREAKVKAARFTEKLRKEEDNQANTLFLYETPFASLQSRLVHTGSLTLFENKIIEPNNAPEVI